MVVGAPRTEEHGYGGGTMRTNRFVINSDKFGYSVAIPVTLNGEIVRFVYRDAASWVVEVPAESRDEIGTTKVLTGPDGVEREWVVWTTAVDGDIAYLNYVSFLSEDKIRPSVGVS